MTKTCRMCGVAKPVDEFYLQASARANGKDWRMSYCKPCLAERMRARIARRTAEERTKYLEHRRENRKPLTDAEKAAARERHTAWRDANREHVRERARVANHAYRRMHPERSRAHYAASDVVNGCSRSGLSVADWRDQLNVFGHRCAYCGSGGKLTIEHVIPISKGGRNEPDNVIPACKPCNLKKHARGILCMVNVRYEGVRDAD